MDDRLQWLALGVAIGSAALRDRLLSEVQAEAFPLGSYARLIRDALAAKDRAELVRVLGLVGVRWASETERAADAVLATARWHGERQRQRHAAEAIGRAAGVMGPEEFRAFLRKQLAGLGGGIPEPGKNGKVRHATHPSVSESDKGHS